jgi:hypothetical protein
VFFIDNITRSRYTGTMDLIIYPEAVRLNAAMIPHEILPEQKDKFAELYYAEVDRYKLKWGTFPGWKIRSRMLGRLRFNFTSGRVGNAAWAMRMGKQGNAAKSLKKFHDLGMTNREMMAWCLAGPGRKKREYDARVNEAEERRARRQPPQG